MDTADDASVSSRYVSVNYSSLSPTVALIMLVVIKHFTQMEDVCAKQANKIAL